MLYIITFFKINIYYLIMLQEGFLRYENEIKINYGSISNIINKNPNDYFNNIHYKIYFIIIDKIYILFITNLYIKYLYF